MMINSREWYHMAADTRESFIHSSLLQCVVVCCSVLHLTWPLIHMIHSLVVVCCSVLQCVAVCCSVLHLTWPLIHTIHPFIWMAHVSHMNDSCLKYERVVSYTWMNYARKWRTTLATGPIEYSMYVIGVHEYTWMTYARKWRTTWWRTTLSTGPGIEYSHRLRVALEMKVCLRCCSVL